MENTEKPNIPNNINLEESKESKEFNNPKKKVDIKSELIDWLDSIAISLTIVVCIFNFFITVVEVHGPSMEETLHEMDRLIISNIFYSPKAGDIIVVNRAGETPIIKRIIAVPGQTVDINFGTGDVFIDGARIVEPYINTLTNLNYDVEFPVKVPQGSYFVLGDNRNDSLDSRSTDIGMIERAKISGRVLLRVYPFDKMGPLQQYSGYN